MFFLGPRRKAAPARPGQRAGCCWAGHTAHLEGTCFVKKQMISSREIVIPVTFYQQLTPLQNDKQRKEQSE